MKCDIFISYKRLDKDKVFPIKDFIERNTGYNCWIDLDGIESDDQFSQVIIEAINNAEVFLFMYSNTHSKIENFEEDWTVREITFAQKKKKRIVFVNLDNAPLTDRFYFMFSIKQQVAASSDVAMKKLCADIKQWLRNEDEVCDDQNSEMGRRNVEIQMSSIKNNTSSKVPIPNNTTQKGNSIASGHEYVDLGLSSGLKWATCNVGSNRPEDSGDYFAWGEKRKKSLYNEESYMFGHYKRGLKIIGRKNFYYDDITRKNLMEDFRPRKDSDKNKYSFVGRGKEFGNRILENFFGDENISGTKYDVVREQWGEKWRMPTKADFEELKNECVWVWTEQNQKKGYKVVGPNGNSIFLPASGVYNSQDGASLSNDGVEGNYWSSSPHDKLDDCAYELFFDSINYYMSEFNQRCHGLSVRPVLEKKVINQK